MKCEKGLLNFIIWTKCLLCSTEERMSYRFGRAWEWINEYHFWVNFGWCPSLRLLSLSDQVHRMSSLHCWCTGLYDTALPGVARRSPTNSKRSIMNSKAVDDQANQSHCAPMPLILPRKDELANMFFLRCSRPWLFHAKPFTTSWNSDEPHPPSPSSDSLAYALNHPTIRSAFHLLHLNWSSTVCMN